MKIDAKIVTLTHETGRKPLRGGRHTPQPVVIQRQVCGIGRGPSLDLDESEHAATACDQIDLTAGHPGAVGKDAPAVKPKP